MEMLFQTLARFSQLEIPLPISVGKYGNACHTFSNLWPSVVLCKQRSITCKLVLSFYLKGH